MPIPFRNATIGARLPIGQAETGPEVQRQCHIQPATATVAYEQFGVEVTKAFLLIDEPETCDPEHANYCYAEFGRVSWGGKEYAVIAVADPWNHHPAAAHVEVLIKEVRLLTENGEAAEPR